MILLFFFLFEWYIESSLTGKNRAFSEWAQALYVCYQEASDLWYWICVRYSLRLGSFDPYWAQNQFK